MVSLDWFIAVIDVDMAVLLLYIELLYEATLSQLSRLLH